MSEKIIGHGVDLVDCARFHEAMQRHEEPFLNRLFTDEEKAYAMAQARPELHLAARFAAKEALSKAMGTGIGSVVGWKDVEVCREHSGAPFIRLHGAAWSSFEQRGGKAIFLSLSHTDQMAMASVILTGHEHS
ncbi:MAG: holo-ACP synthase [Candidatus Methylacidiphilales bacterium]